MERATLTWGLVLIFGVPMLTIGLGEVAGRLEWHENPLAGVIRNLRRSVLLSGAVLLLLQQIFRLDPESVLVRALTTGLGVAAIWTAISLANVVLVVGTKQYRWQIEVSNLLFQVVRVLVVLAVGSYLLGDVWDFDLKEILSALGVGSLVFALAVQDTLSNLVSGFLLIFESPFQVGDWIRVDDLEGEVLEINWRAVRLKTRERDIIVIPNGKLGETIIQNYTLEDPLHGVRVSIPFSDRDPPNKVIRVLQEAAASVEGIFQDPMPEVRPIAFENAVVTYEVEYYIQEYGYAEEIQGQLLVNIYYASKRHHLTAPIPARQYSLLQQPKKREEDESREVLEILRSLSTFQRLSSRSLESLARQFSYSYFGMGECIVKAEEFDSGFQLILEGNVILTVADGQGKEQEVMRLSRGDCLGEMAFLQVEPSLVTAIAATDVQTVAIAPDAIWELAQQYPEFAQAMQAFVEERKNAILLIREVTSSR